MHIYLVHCGTNLTKNHNSSIFKPLRSPPQAAMTRRPDLHHGGNSLGQSHSNAGVAQIQTWWYGLPWTMQSYKKLIWHEAVVYIAMHYARQVRWIFPKTMRQRLDWEWSSVTNMGVQVPFEGSQVQVRKTNSSVTDWINQQKHLETTTNIIEYVYPKVR